MSGEKTEKPTPKKRRDAKKKGQVAKSKEVVSLALLLTIAGYFWLFGDFVLAQLLVLFELPQTYYFRPLDANVTSVFVDFVVVSGKLLAPLLGLVFVVGIVSNVAQTGWVFSGEAIKPEIKKIDPVQGAKKIFSLKNLMEFFKSLTKIIVLGLTAYYIFHTELNTLFGIPHCGVSCAMSLTGSLVMKLIFYCLGVFIFLAGADFALEQYLHTKQLKMSKDEVKREYKESEGSPEIKGKRKQLHQELMNETVKKQVAQTDFVVTNPIRLAVGIRYDKEFAPLPIVTIKGEHINAKRIREEAIRQGVPIIEKKYLARALYAELEMDDFITADFIEPIAEIIKWVRDLEKT